MIDISKSAHEGILETALAYHDAGLCVLPVPLDGSKYPDPTAIPEWERYKTERPDRDLVEVWFMDNDKGVCVIAGPVSGGLEALDFDNKKGRLGDAFERWRGLLPPELFARLYVATTPGGRFGQGYRVCYKCDAEGKYVEKLARAAPDDCIIEVLNAGHVVLVPGGHPDAHATRKPYVTIQGDLTALPTLTPEERRLLLDAARSQDRVKADPAPHRESKAGKAVPLKRAARPEGGAARAGDDFNARATWAEVLEPHGWTLDHEHGDMGYWCRPAKDRGVSATTNYADQNLLHVFSSNADPFEPDKSYSLFAAYTQLNHGGDFDEAARTLARKGYGSRGRPARAGGDDAKSRPEIGVGGKQLPALAAEAVAALAAANQPPRLFRRGGAVVRVSLDPAGGRPALDSLGLDGLRGELARAADWVTYRKEGTVATYPPEAVVRDLLSRTDWKLPNLKGIVETPVFAAGGRLVSTPGYDERSGLWYQPAHGLDLPDVSEHPGPADIRRARELLLDDLLGDFPLADEASKANVLALFLLPFARPLIDGPTPLHVVNAPTERTGKTLLAKCFAAVATGRGLDDSSECGHDEEWRKTLTSLLSDGPVYVCFDNLSMPLNSATLAKVLTDRVHQDRVLGRNDLVRRLPVECVWLATGNNVRASKEIAGRTVLVEIDAWLENPQLRDDFRHPLPGWAVENRGQLVWACLTLCQAWVAAGMPAGPQVMGGFEQWARVMGGILDVAGIAGFLGNRDKVLAEVNSSDGEWREGVQLWWDTFQDRPVSASDLAHLLVSRGLLLATFDRCRDDTDRARRLGMALNRMVHRIYAGLRIEKGTDGHRKSNTYRLVPVPGNGPKEAETPAGSAGTSAGSPRTTPRNAGPYTTATCSSLRGVRGLPPTSKEVEAEEDATEEKGATDSPHSPQVAATPGDQDACVGGSPAGSAGSPQLPALTRGLVPYDRPYRLQWAEGPRGRRWPSLWIEGMTEEEVDVLDVDSRRELVERDGDAWRFTGPLDLALLGEGDRGPISSSGGPSSRRL